ncbi:MAG: sigma 54-interacting transcriptional regulator [Spirochaetales bacterium]|nr:sigma 54-interacting transcriptional regulator [Spirochaetales bacterium]
MERFYYLGDGDRFIQSGTDEVNSFSFVSGFQLDSFLERKKNINFDLMFLDGLVGAGEVQNVLLKLDRDVCSPPVILISSNTSNLPSYIYDHNLIIAVYDGPPLLGDLIGFARKALRAHSNGGSHFDGMTEYMGMIGKSPAIKALWSKIDKYGDSAHKPVLIQGENGTGKELVAKALSLLCCGEDAPFVPYQASASADNLLASELFGVKKGAYTGSENRMGLLKKAKGGVFFLDEIGLLKERDQSVLLRVLQEGKARALGSEKETTLDFKLLSATNEDLQAALREGRFRRDLLHRINVFTINVPPLRERKEDIPLLIQAFLKLEKRDKEFSEAALGKLQNYEWPGNIRELKNMVSRASIESGKNRLIEARHVIF